MISCTPATGVWVQVWMQNLGSLPEYSRSCSLTCTALSLSLLSFLLLSLRMPLSHIAQTAFHMWLLRWQVVGWPGAMGDRWGAAGNRLGAIGSSGNPIITEMMLRLTLRWTLKLR